MAFITRGHTPTRRIVVAGGAGFIGSHMCRALLERGDEVVCVDNLVTGRFDNVVDLVRHPNFAFRGDDITQLKDVAGPVDAVINLASPASPADFARLGIEILEVGSIGTQRLLELARDKEASFVQASTSEIYGEPLVHPQPEEYWGNVNCNGPRSVYDESKRFGEAITMAYHRIHGVDTRIVRIFNTYGPRMRPEDGRVVSNFVWSALRGAPLTIYGDGLQTRSFCYVDDQVRGQLALLDAETHDPVNIGNPHEFTIRELADVVLEVTGSDSEIVHCPRPVDDPTHRRPDISRAERELAWRPIVSLREGIARMADWFGCELDAGAATLATSTGRA